MQHALSARAKETFWWIWAQTFVFALLYLVLAPRFDIDGVLLICGILISMIAIWQYVSRIADSGMFGLVAVLALIMSWDSFEFSGLINMTMAIIVITAMGTLIAIAFKSPVSFLQFFWTLAMYEGIALGIYLEVTLGETWRTTLITFGATFALTGAVMFYDRWLYHRTKTGSP